MTRPNAGVRSPLIPAERQRENIAANIVAADAWRSDANITRKPPVQPGGDVLALIPDLVLTPSAHTIWRILTYFVNALFTTSQQTFLLTGNQRRVAHASCPIPPQDGCASPSYPYQDPLTFFVIFPAHLACARSSFQEFHAAKQRGLSQGQQGFCLVRHGIKFFWEAA